MGLQNMFYRRKNIFLFSASEHSVSVRSTVYKWNSFEGKTADRFPTSYARYTHRSLQGKHTYCNFTFRLYK